MSETFAEARNRGWRNPAELLASLVSGQHPDGRDFALPTRAAGAARALAGYGWTGGLRLAPTAGQQASWTLSNPAGSGRMAVVHAFAVYCDTAGAVRFLRDAASAGALTTPIYANPAVEGLIAPVAELRAGVDVLTGGILQDPEGRVGGEGSPYKRDHTVHAIPPGVAFSLTYEAPGGLTGGADASCSVDWLEYPAEWFGL